ncbi:MAG: ATP phosphoribosyltransferase [Leptolyngbya sp. PLA3]|nr:MAG: ATP phosphoribosyltransferase [Cyanobacteria bacterium CYA]MCE7969285.1 ATP phosphoribosyltransferase [Leptolyngbya sp. PL-A3]
MNAQPTGNLCMAVPKGRMQTGVTQLLADAGIRLDVASRNYRPIVSAEGMEVKILKPQAIIEMLAVGSRDVGFAGADWVAEFEADLVELLDTGLDPVRLVAAAPERLLLNGALPRQRLVVASEYVRLAQRWIDRRGLDATLLRSFGATEVLPPEDADVIVDNTASGATLTANDLRIVDELMTSSTRLYASKHAMADADKRERIEEMATLVQSVLTARRRVMVELNVGPENLERVIEVLPCMREPTVSTLHASAGYAVKAAVPREDLPRVIPLIRARGGTDIVVSRIEQIVV